MAISFGHTNKIYDTESTLVVVTSGSGSGSGWQPPVKRAAVNPLRTLARILLGERIAAKSIQQLFYGVQHTHIKFSGVFH